MKSKRIFSYDFFRGVLVVAMIVAHTVYNFSAYPQGYEKYFLWVPAGFVFFSGLITGQYLVQKKKNLYFFRRGIQLLGTFLVLNALLLLSSEVNIIDLSKYFLIGGQSIFAFEILVPIGISLFMIPLIKKVPAPLGFFWGLFFLILLDVYSKLDVFYSYNLQFVLIGIVGFFFGKEGSLDGLRKDFHNAFQFSWLVNLFFVVLIFWSFFHIHNQTFQLVITSWSIQILLLIPLFFLIPNSIFEIPPGQPKPLIRKFLERIGVYSLFLYLFHIAVIKYITFFFPDLFFDSFFLYAMFAFHITVLCFAIVEVFEVFFHKFPFFGRIFRFFF